ncbi:MAG: alpha-D-glucose phosphate-specific phosphoglucomutase [Gemmatimonadales bacterium]|nr:alpha-D-glucose phosphate-specific phosphoglucomutase [Gemmatimonadales bacterium]
MLAPRFVTHVAPDFGRRSPGTSGLRRPTAEFRQPHYLASFAAAILAEAVPRHGATIVLGGDGRTFVGDAVQQILRLAAAWGVERAIVGQGGLLSTPAASHLIRLRGAVGGIILSASHNPGGPDGDFGIKYNGENGGPAPPAITDAIADRATALREYRMVEHDDIAIDRLGEQHLGPMVVEVVDPVADYATLMESLVDVAAIRALFARGFTMQFDAMHAVTGPYAVELLERRLGAPAGSVVRGTPLPDFGGEHPDPNLVHAAELVEAVMHRGEYDFGAASDGDGDRNMIVGRGTYVAPSDSLAVLAAQLPLLPGYAAGLAGVARSMPTSRAVDRVAAALAIPCYETPTGWKFFCSLLDAGRITLCGEESFGTGSSHVREKDGLWAVLCWLNILAATGQSVRELLEGHWQRFGRDYYSRHDYEDVSTASGDAVMGSLRERLATLPGTVVAGRTILAADDFAFTDPVDGSTATAQGIRLLLDGDARIVVRLSGTGTRGATIRLYLEQVGSGTPRVTDDVQSQLASVIAVALTVTNIATHTGRPAPSVIT